MSPSDISGIRLQGNEHEVDSLVACIQATMAYWGQTVPYEYAAGLLGSAFSPALSEDRTCAAWWMESAADARIAFSGHALGFEVERSLARNVKSPQAISSFVRHAATALGRGGVVLCNARPRWGIAIGWSDDLSHVSFATPRGLEAGRTETPWTAMYVLRPCERSLSQGEALREALRFGAEVAVGTYAPEGSSYGGRLYDAWLARLTKEHFCPKCGQNGWKCAERTASRARGTQLAAAGFLEQTKAFLPGGCGTGRVDKIAASYAAMAKKLAPYVAGCGLNGIWSDPLKRARYAQDVADVRHLHHTAALRLLVLACLL